MLLDAIDIDFPTTSLRDEIPSHDCYVANQGEAIQSTDQEETKIENSVENKYQDKDIFVESTVTKSIEVESGMQI